MKKIGIVVLNYLNYTDTIECIQSLIDVNYDNFEIIVVDNCSNNESYDALQKEIAGQKNITLLSTDVNIGFSKGNNTGIEYARNVLECEYVLLLNNDTIVIDKDMITKLIEKHDMGIAAIGPRILGSDNVDQNPIYTVVNKSNVENHLRLLNSLKLKIIQTSAYQACSKNTIIKKIKNIFIGNREFNKVLESSKNEYILHGACLLLTPDYFKRYPILFPNTFLYYEENILALLCYKANLKLIFTEDTSIYHKEDQSSIMSFKNKNSIKNKYEIDSCNECIKLFDMTYPEIFNTYFKD